MRAIPSRPPLRRPSAVRAWLMRPEGQGNPITSPGLRRRKSCPLRRSAGPGAQVSATTLTVWWNLPLSARMLSALATRFSASTRNGARLSSTPPRTLSRGAGDNSQTHHPRLLRQRVANAHQRGRGSWPWQTRRHRRASCLGSASARPPRNSPLSSSDEERGFPRPWRRTKAMAAQLYQGRAIRLWGEYPIAVTCGVLHTDPTAVSGW